MSSSSQISKSIPAIMMEDIVVCQECPKADVCMVIRTITAQYEQNKQMIEQLKKEFNVQISIQLNASITECPHRPEHNLL